MTPCARCDQAKANGGMRKQHSRPFIGPGVVCGGQQVHHATLTGPIVTRTIAVKVALALRRFIPSAV